MLPVESLSFYSLRKDTEFYGEFSPPDLLVSLRTSLAELPKYSRRPDCEQRSVHSPCSLNKKKCSVLLHSNHSIPFLYNPSAEFAKRLKLPEHHGTLQVLNPFRHVVVCSTLRMLYEDTGIQNVNLYRIATNVGLFNAMASPVLR
jgi:hypothetical protein